MPSSDSDVLLEAPVDSDSDVILEPRRRRHIIGTFSEHGPNFLCAVFADRDGHFHIPRHHCRHVIPDIASARYWFLGMLVLTWNLVNSERVSATRKIVKCVHQRIYSKLRPCAWIEYRIADMCTTDPVPIDFGPDVSRHQFMLKATGLVNGSLDIARFVERHSLAVKDFVFLSVQVATCVFNKCAEQLYLLPVLEKVRDWPFSVRPDFGRLRTHIAELGTHDPQPLALSSAMRRAHMPPAVASFLIDPLQYLSFLEATQYLKQLKFLAKASNAMVRALWPEESQAMFADLLNTGFVFPSSQSLARARPQLDSACMLLERVEWNTGRFMRRPGRPRRIHLTADGSPNSGRDIFGIIMDTWHTLFLVF